MGHSHENRGDKNDLLKDSYFVKQSNTSIGEESRNPNPQGYCSLGYPEQAG